MRKPRIAPGLFWGLGIVKIYKKLKGQGGAFWVAGDIPTPPIFITAAPIYFRNAAVFLQLENCATIANGIITAVMVAALHYGA